MKSQTEHPGLLKIKTSGCEKTDLNHDRCTVTQMTVGATLPIPSAPQYMFSETVIGPMLDVEQALCPHHEVKFTFMKLKSQVGFLC